MPYIWTLGIMIFSTGLFIGGAAGEPRRTNLGVSYSDPHSSLYHADWNFANMMGSVGGIIMTIAGLMFFVVFFATLFGRATRKGALDLIVSEVYHDERVPAVQSFTPWLAGAALLLVILTPHLLPKRYGVAFRSTRLFSSKPVAITAVPGH